ncbi:MAG: DNA primase [candidate division WOR-3 bacterium]
MLSPIDEIKSKLDILEVIQGYIRTQKAGNNWRALCPFHNEKTPSLYISPDKQVWHCFGCGRGGSIFQFVMEMEGLDFSDALRMLAQKAGVELKKYDKSFYTKRSKILEINEIALNFYLSSLKNTRGGKRAFNYLLSRGLNEKTIKEFKIGYAPNNWQALTNLLKSKNFSEEEIILSGFGLKAQSSLNQKKNIYDRFRGRIMFPIFSINGEVIAFSGRILPELETKKDGTKEAKYINTPNTPLYEKSNVLYNLDKARNFIKQEKFALIVEGNLDMILSYQAGVKNVVAPCGTALTPEHLKILKRYSSKVSLAFDNDEAGLEAGKKSVRLCLANDMSVKIVPIVKGKDPADFIKEDQALWIKSVAEAKEAIEFYFDVAAANIDPKNLSGKKEMVGQLLWLLSSIKNPIDKSYWTKILAEKINLPEEALLDMIESYESADNISASAQIKTEQKTPILRNNIEDNVVAIFLKYPELFSKWKDILNGKKLLTNHLNSKILNLLIDNQPLTEVQDDVNRLLLRAEYFFENENLAEKELAFCITYLQKRNLKLKIREIKEKIKNAEKENDQKTIENLQDILNKILISNNSNNK